MMNINEIKEHLEYRDGSLYWLKPTSNSVKTGDLAGCNDKNGYTLIKFKKKYIYAHRLIFMMFNGYIPNIVDHIDGNPKNNKIENLRDSNKAENAWNAKLAVNNTSGIKGVSWNKQTKRWKAEISFNGYRKFLGRFLDINDAKKAIESARIEYHNEFARHC